MVVPSDRRGICQSLFQSMLLTALLLSKGARRVEAFRPMLRIPSQVPPSTCFSKPESSLFLVARRLSSDSNENGGSPSSLSKEDKFSAYRNKNNVRDQVLSAISGDGGIKVTVATVRNLVNDVMMQHTMTALPADALGRTMTCALLMANGMQDEQIVQITMNGTPYVKCTQNRCFFGV